MTEHRGISNSADKLGQQSIHKKLKSSITTSSHHIDHSIAFRKSHLSTPPVAVGKNHPLAKLEIKNNL